jgi:thymidine kinase
MRTVIRGPMFSGKTSMLNSISEEFERNGERVLFVTHCTDYRTEDSSIRTHTGRFILNCIRVPNLQVILSMVGDYSICLIDEVQFFTDAVAFLHRTRSFKDLKLFFSGLNYDVHRRPFPVTYTLSLLCDQVITLRSRCYKCTSDAEYTVFEGNNTDAGDGNFIHVGTEGYKAICGSCF